MKAYDHWFSWCYAPVHVVHSALDTQTKRHYVANCLNPAFRATNTAHKPFPLRDFICYSLLSRESRCQLAFTPLQLSKYRSPPIQHYSIVGHPGQQDSMILPGKPLVKQTLPLWSCLIHHSECDCPPSELLDPLKTFCQILYIRHLHFNHDLTTSQGLDPMRFNKLC